MRLLLGFYKASAVPKRNVRVVLKIYNGRELVKSPMQVATLFRESSTLLGATMESGGGGGGQDSGVSSLGPGPLSYESYNHPVTFSNKYKL